MSDIEVDDDFSEVNGTPPQVSPALESDQPNINEFTRKKLAENLLLVLFQVSVQRGSRSNL